MKSAVNMMAGAQKAASGIVERPEQVTNRAIELMDTGESVFKSLLEARLGDRLQRLEGLDKL